MSEEENGEGGKAEKKAAPKPAPPPPVEMADVRVPLAVRGFSVAPLRACMSAADLGARFVRAAQQAGFVKLRPAKPAEKVQETQRLKDKEAKKIRAEAEEDAQNKIRDRDMAHAAQMERTHAKHADTMREQAEKHAAAVAEYKSQITMANRELDALRKELNALRLDGPAGEAQTAEEIED